MNRRVVLFSVIIICVVIVFYFGWKVLGQKEDSLQPGEVSWEDALVFFETCRVKFAGQSHSLSVGLVLIDGQEIATREPIIDEVFRVAEQFRGRCGTIPIATE